jgi:hypothetical protein
MTVDFHSQLEQMLLIGFFLHHDINSILAPLKPLSPILEPTLSVKYQMKFNSKHINAVIHNDQLRWKHNSEYI